ncbi:LPS assembly protein LptD [Celeribacter arenosi]|uniref:LPS-assembly protein LptD n=2 Tax=Celeribacter arenosi TaxID=792649 RepID=A0ABP7KEM7_9RHOB
MRRFLFVFVLRAVMASCLMVVAWPQSARAQQETPVTLLADTVRFDGTTLTASGAVEVFFQGRRLQASKIIYNNATGDLEVLGPIRLTEAGGNTIILASQAAIDSDLQNGILTSARIVVDRQFQIAAAQLDLINGRYTRAARAVASTCEVCIGQPVPIWEIRAAEVIRDDLEKQIYFNDAQFRLFGVPVLYLPHLRVPDPSLERATGFLVPVIRSSSRLGLGIEVPYFVTLGDHADLTFTPYLSRESRSLDLRYRRATPRGGYEINAAISRDSLVDDMRGYAFLQGAWDVGRGLTFGVDLRTTSDIAYLVDYGIYDGDRLPSRLTLSRYGASGAVDAEIIEYRTLRESEVAIADTLPFLIGSVRYETRVEPANLPGRLTFGLSASGSYRVSDADVEGTDILRVGADATWQVGTIVGPGITLDTRAAIDIDAYSLHQNSEYDETALRVTPAAEVQIGWPMVRATRNGAVQVVEPLLQLGWSQTYGGDVPNIDSSLIEFEEGNLLTLSRFPGADRRATGLAGAVGLRFTHTDSDFTASGTIGRVVSAAADPDFSQASGLSGVTSDWLLAGHLSFPKGVAVDARAVIDETFGVTKFETRMSIDQPTYGIGAHYAWVIADALETRDETLSELGLDARVDLGSNWSAEARYIYDFTAQEATRAGVAIAFENECVRMRFDVSRRYSETEALSSNTDYGFTVGFGAFDGQSGCRR